jgi:hypothetical protein
MTGIYYINKLLAPIPVQQLQSIKQNILLNNTSFRIEKIRINFERLSFEDLEKYSRSMYQNHKIRNFGCDIT